VACPPSGGRGIYTMEYNRYEPMPLNIAQPIIAAFKPHPNND